MPKSMRDLYKSFGYITYFNIALFILLAIVFLAFSSYFSDANFRIALFIVFVGNIFLAFFTQIANYVIEKYNVLDKTREFLFVNFVDCFLRSGAGVAEIILYTVFFSFKLETIVAGYLLLKTVSIWQDNVHNKKEGLHTAILRIAIAISLLIALTASFYLRKFILAKS